VLGRHQDACVASERLRAYAETVPALPNVFVTGHQAYFTREALASIAETTLKNVADFEQGKECANTVHCDRVKSA